MMTIRYRLYDRVHVSIYLDTSISMMSQDMDGLSRFSVAQQILSQITDALPSDTLYDLILVGAVPVLIAKDVDAQTFSKQVYHTDPHRLTLHPDFAGSVLGHIRWYQKSYLHTRSIIVLTDGWQTSGQFFSTDDIQSVIIGIGTSGWVLGTDLIGRQIVTSLDHQNLNTLTSLTHSILLIVDDVDDITQTVNQITWRLYPYHTWRWYMIVVFLSFLIGLFVYSSMIIYRRYW